MRHDPKPLNAAEAVAFLRDAPPTERRVVEALRLWLEGPEAQAAAWRAFAADQGAEAGRVSLRAFEAYLLAVAEGAARRLRRHRLGCPCVAEDEAALAAAVAAAACDDREAAYAALHGLVRPEAAPRAVAAAAALDRALAERPADQGGSAARAAPFRRLH